MKRPTYEVYAKPWDRGWELHIDNVGVTQCRTIPEEAELMIRDYVATVLNVPVDSFDIEIFGEAHQKPQY
ncbi:hypothetical protein [Streptomyces sp. NPDC055085]